MDNILWLPNKSNIRNYIIKRKVDVICFIEDQYKIFYKQFLNDENPLLFNGLRVIPRPKILDCSNCNNTCSNNIRFNCLNCPYKNKEDIFQHITSDKDKRLNVSKKYRKKENRTPGIFNIKRTERIGWLRPIIENSNDTENVLYFEENSKSGELKKYFWLKSRNFVLIIVESMWEKDKFNYINTSYFVEYDSQVKRLERLYTEYLKTKKRQSLGVS